MLLNDSGNFHGFIGQQCEEVFVGIPEREQQAELDAAQAAIDEDRSNPFDHCELDESDFEDEDEREWNDTESYYDDENIDFHSVDED